MSPVDHRTHYFFFDTGRALFMLLGIPYHAALIYMPDNHWRIQSPDTDPILVDLAALSPFRMPAFFIIAGFFSALLLQKRTVSRWIKLRYIRLGIPFITAMLLLNPIQMLITVMADPAISREHILSEWFTLMSTPGDHWVTHLWFLPVLTLHCTVLALVWKRWFASGVILKTFLYKNLLSSWYSLSLAVLIIAIWEIGVAGSQQVLGLQLSFASDIINLEKTAAFAPYYLLGVFMALDKRMFSILTTHNRSSILVGMIGVLLYISTWLSGRAEFKVINVASAVLIGLFASQVAFSLLRRFANRGHNLVSFFVKASFTIYLFHHATVILFGYVFLKISWHPIFEFLLVSLACLAVTTAIAILVQKNRYLRFLFNGVPLASKSRHYAPMMPANPRDAASP